MFRKSSIATVKLVPGVGSILVNDKDFVSYMQNNPSLILLGLERKYDVVANALGGGLTGQAEAILKLGISRALFNLVELDDQRKLKMNGFLTRNSLCKERRSLYRYLLLCLIKFLQKLSSVFLFLCRMLSLITGLLLF
uniref:ribosomal protein S9 n=1 Tax=Euglena undulata TaxID=1685799 RepID=UPI0023AA22A0|nr:ribosomal protein S9 [Euglena undulata]WCH63447.1 ribosomal protein S9 [Euglena undulata]